MYIYIYLYTYIYKYLYIYIHEYMFTYMYILVVVSLCPPGCMILQPSLLADRSSICAIRIIQHPVQVAAVGFLKRLSLVMQTSSWTGVCKCHDCVCVALFYQPNIGEFLQSRVCHW